MSDYTTIPLSKTGKHKDKYRAVVSDEDKDLAELNWSVHIRENGKRHYAIRALYSNGKKFADVLLHRVILERMIAPLKLEKCEDVDHIDGNGLNNARSNLRLATRSQNQANRGMSKNNKSGYKGVCYDKKGNKWTASIGHKGKRYAIGRYNTPEEAHEAYKAKAKELFGEFSRFE